MRAAAYRYIGASFSLLPSFVLSPCRKASPSRTEKKSSWVPPPAHVSPGCRALGALSGAQRSFCFPSSQTGVETSLLAQTEKGKKASDAQCTGY